MTWHNINTFFVCFYLILSDYDNPILLSENHFNLQPLKKICTSLKFPTLLKNKRWIIQSSHSLDCNRRLMKISLFKMHFFFPRQQFSDLKKTLVKVSRFNWYSISFEKIQHYKWKKKIFLNKTSKMTFEDDKATIYLNN